MFGNGNGYKCEHGVELGQHGRYRAHAGLCQQPSGAHSILTTEVFMQLIVK